MERIKSSQCLFNERVWNGLPVTLIFVAVGIVRPLSSMLVFFDGIDGVRTFPPAPAAGPAPTAGPATAVGCRAFNFARRSLEI